MTDTYAGTGVTPLSGVGTAVWYDPGGFEYEREGSDPETELERFRRARETVDENLAEAREGAIETMGEEQADVFEVHRQFLDDPELESGIEEHVADGHSAGAAIERTFDELIDRFEGLEGRMAGRADDLRDVRDRLIGAVTGTEGGDLESLPPGTVLLAERLTPSDAAQLDPDSVAGFATVTGSETSHAAIFARSLAVPAVVGVGESLRVIPDGTEVLVDGSAGTVVTHPDDDARDRARTDHDTTVIEPPVETADGTPVDVAANVGTAGEVEPARSLGADGIGLYRTEFLFANRESPPGEDEQYEVYSDALSVFPEGRVVVRTLDVGGDKPLQYLDTPTETNPFLGVRGVRRSLGPDGDLFETQIRALLRAAGDASGSLAVMFPLVATVEEFEQAREQLERATDELRDRGVPHGEVEVGVMVETPSATYLAPELARRADFLSIGTNDLTQYMMAADRENEDVAALHDPLYPAVLRAIRRTVEAGREYDAAVAVCGEIAGDPDATELLLGLGVEELSMSAATIPRVKARVRQTRITEARELAGECLRADTREEVLERLSRTQ